jgi:trehalose 6-phosphate phosphatase
VAAPNPLIKRFRQARERAGLFLDFDGTLSNIVPRPELARPAPGAVIVLSRLAQAYGVVALVSGRPADEVARLVPVRGIEVFGTYGLSDAISSPRVRRATGEVEEAARAVRGAWVEDKGVSLAVHYRAAEDTGSAERVLHEALRTIAERHGLAVMPGKMVLELVPPDTPGKGSVIAREQQARGLTCVLYAGDDTADLDAFVALDRLRDEGLLTIKIAVRSEETPDELVSRADLVVGRPAGLVELLSEL